MKENIIMYNNDFVNNYNNSENNHIQNIKEISHRKGNDIQKSFESINEGSEEYNEIEDNSANLHGNNINNKILPTTNKKNINKRDKYRKKKKNHNLKENIQYIELIEIKNGNKFEWKFSLSKFNKNFKTGYYYCSDISCNATGYNTFNLNDGQLLYETINDDNFKIKNKHKIPCSSQTYIIDKDIKKDYMKLNKNYRAII